jgi:hypothetical protein
VATELERFRTHARKMARRPFDAKTRAQWTALADEADEQIRRREREEVEGLFEAEPTDDDVPLW